jgi:hypothetical protein
MRCATGVSMAGSASSEILNEEFFETGLENGAESLVLTFTVSPQSIYL